MCVCLQDNKEHITTIRSEAERVIKLYQYLFGHGFDKLVYALLCGGDTKFKVPKAEMATCFFLTRG